MPPESPIDRALTSVPRERRFIVAYANPDRPQIVMTLHSMDDSSGEAYATRTITLEDEGLVIYDTRNDYKEVVCPVSADGIEDQVKTLVYAFADELSVADNWIRFGGRAAGRAAETGSLELAACWRDAALLSRAQSAFRGAGRATAEKDA